MARVQFQGQNQTDQATSDQDVGLSFFEHIFAVFKLRGQLKATSASAATTVSAGQMLFEMSSSFFLVYLRPKYEWNLCLGFLLYTVKRGLAR